MEDSPPEACLLTLKTKCSGIVVNICRLVADNTLLLIIISSLIKCQVLKYPNVESSLQELSTYVLREHDSNLNFCDVAF